MLPTTANLAVQMSPTHDEVTGGWLATVAGMLRNDALDSTITSSPVSGTEATIASAPGARAVARSQPDYPQLERVPPDHYVLGDLLARGGMGRVTRARDRRLGREVAIKSIVRDSAELAARLEREARITARLHHPAIVNVHEAGVWPDGTPFYAMELVAGRSLGDALAGTRTLADRLALLPHGVS